MGRIATRDRTKDAYQELVRQELPGLYSLARRLVRDGAEDLVQEALLQGYRAFGSLKEQAAGGRWLKTILVNVFRDELRKRGRRVEEVAVGDLEDFSLYRTLIDEDPLPYSDSLHTDFLGAFDRDDLREVLLRMPEIYRAPLVLRYMDGFVDERDRPAPGRSARDDPRPPPPRPEAARADDVGLRRGEQADHDGRRRWVRRRPRSLARRRSGSSGTTSTTRSRRRIRRRSSTTSRSAVDAAASSSSRRRSGGSWRLGSSDEVPPHVKERLEALRGGAVAVAKDLMYQDEIKDAVRDAYGSIATGAGEVVAGRLYSEEELAELPAGRRRLGARASATPSDTRSSSRARSSSTSGRAAGSTRSWPRGASGPTGRAIGLDIVDAMIDRARAQRGRGRGRRLDGVPPRARWSRSRCPTRRSTS